MIEEGNKGYLSEDDGGLACLNIPRDENSRSFNCETTSQSKLVNTTFWVVDIIENVETRFSKQKDSAGKMLVKIKQNKDSPESECKKFFTGSADILYVPRKVKEMGKNSKNLLKKVIRMDFYKQVA